MTNSETAQYFSNLSGQQYMSLTTFRKNGEGVATPVWFATDASKLYVLSEKTAGKLKRIAHTPQVTVAPSTFSGKVTGETAQGTARLLVGKEADFALACLNKKYGLIKRLFDFYGWLRRSEIVYLEITPL